MHTLVIPVLRWVETGGLLGLPGYHPSCRFGERVLYISYVSVAVIRQHDQRQRKEGRFGLYGPKGRGGQAAEQEAERSHLLQPQAGCREWERRGTELSKLLTVMPFPQHGCTAPQPLSRVPPTVQINA